MAPAWPVNHIKRRPMVWPWREKGEGMQNFARPKEPLIRLPPPFAQHVPLPTDSKSTKRPAAAANSFSRFLPALRCSALCVCLPLLRCFISTRPFIHMTKCPPRFAGKSKTRKLGANFSGRGVRNLPAVGQQQIGQPKEAGKTQTEIPFLLFGQG